MCYYINKLIVGWDRFAIYQVNCRVKANPAKTEQDSSAWGIAL